MTTVKGELQSALKGVNDVYLIIEDIKKFMGSFPSENFTYTQMSSAIFMMEKGLDFAQTHLKGACIETLEAVTSIMSMEKGDSA